MQCFICGEPMRVVMVEPHHQIDMPGFELRTFQCVGCGDIEKHPVFDSEHARQVSALVPEAEVEAVTQSDAPAPSVHPQPPAAAPAPNSRKKSIFSSFAKLRGSKQAEP